MACDITEGRSRPCKGRLGGLDLIYIAPYVKYSKSLIVRNELILTSFPDTTVYAFEIAGGDYSENSEIDGEDFINQSLNVTFIGLNEDNQWKKLLRKDHIVVLKDRNGKFRLMGAYNGATTEYQGTTGASHPEFNGWTLNFTAKEQDQALYFDNLEDVGFTIATDNFLLLENGEFVLTEDNQKIIVEA